VTHAYLLGTVHRDATKTELTSPTVGIFTSIAAVGELVSPGQVIGSIEVLAVKHALRVPDGVAGRAILDAGGGRARVPVQYGDTLFTLSTGSEVGLDWSTPRQAVADQAKLAFLAPMSGRFYGRPSPTEAAFISEGDTVRKGQTVGLLEVMKTFNRLVYQGELLPESAVVQKILPNDGDDVVRGDVILALRPDGGKSAL